MGETTEQKPQLKLGSLVLATRMDNKLDCKGVFVEETDNGTIMVQCESGLFECQPGAIEIPEAEIRDKRTQIFVRKARKTSIIQTAG